MGRKLAMRELWTDEPTNTQKNNTGTPNAQQRGEKDTKSTNEICSPDFFSSSMVTGQVAWWCVGRE
jgi:hypothetical protein